MDSNKLDGVSNGTAAASAENLSESKEPKW
jgi:hypothetical protein